MKTWFRMTVGLPMLLAGLVSFAGAASAADCRIGYIDVPRVLEEYEDFKEARSDLEKARADREEEAAKRFEEIQKLAKELKEKGSILSESKRRSKEQEYMKKQQDLQKWGEEQRKELAEREEGMVKRLEADVRKVLEVIAVDEKVDFVVRRDLFLYMKKDSKDLTSAVLAELRKQAKAKEKSK
jgi:outer membrane protein